MKRPTRADHRIRLVNHMAAGWWHRILLRSEEALSYLEGRGFTPAREIAERYGLGFAPLHSMGHGDVVDFLRRELQEWGDTLDADLIEAGVARESRRKAGQARDWLYGRILFPIHLKGKRGAVIERKSQIIGFGGRWIPGIREGTHEPPKYLNTPDSLVFAKSEVLYGMPLASELMQGHRALVIAEGYLDVIRLLEAGIPAVAPLGTSLTDGHVDLIPQGKPSMVPRVYLATDGDAAGERAMRRAVRKILNQRPDVEIRIVELPEGLDPDSYILDRGGESYRDLLRESLSPGLWKVRRIEAPEGAPRLHDLHSILLGLRDWMPTTDQDRQVAVEEARSRIWKGWGVDIPRIRLSSMLSPPETCRGEKG